jgi:hypothetical protein
MEWSFDELSPVDSTQTPEALHAQVRASKRALLRGLFLCFVTLITILSLCFAWFISNTQVATNALHVQASDSSPFELAAAGTTAGSYDNALKSEVLGWDTTWTTGTQSTIKDSSDPSTTFTVTATGSAASQINWVMSADSNLNNTSNASSEKQGLSPGASGQLTFYVIPKQSGDMTIRFDLSLTPYTTVTGNTTTDGVISFTSKSTGTTLKVAPSTDETANDLLSGHLLFFLNRDENGYYSDWIEDGTFSIELKNAVVDAAQSVTLYWVWPYIVGQMVLPTSSAERLSPYSLLFSNEDMRAALLKDMKSNLFTKYLYEDIATGDTGATQAQTNLVNSLDTLFGGSLSLSEYYNYDQYYNQADQYIADHISCVLLRLSARLS